MARPAPEQTAAFTARVSRRTPCSVHEAYAALLEELYEWCTRDEFVYMHNWQYGDAVLWDNACTMHRREPFDNESQRLMKRTTILPPSELAVPQ